MNRKKDNHLRISSGQLRKDVLDEIIGKSALTRCPYCGTPLKLPQCSLSESAVLKFASGIQKVWKECVQCKVFWILKLEEWEEERGDGMVKDSGLRLSLEGETNCYCRRSVFESTDWLVLTNKHSEGCLFTGNDDKKNQTDMAYTYTFDLRTMGLLLTLDPPHRVGLNEEFLKEKLPKNVSLIDKPSNVICPFCKIGRLVLKTIGPLYGGRMRSGPCLHEVGSEYKYECSQEGCGAKFDGSICWMWVD